MITQMLTVATILGGAYLFYLWFRQSGVAHETTFKHHVLNDAAHWLAGQLGAAEADVAGTLRNLIENGVPHALLAPLRGIDCEVVKLTPSTGRRTVVVMIDQGDGNARIGKIAREVGWDDMPDAVRADFIKLGGDTHTFQIIRALPATKEVPA